MKTSLKYVLVFCLLPLSLLVYGHMDDELIAEEQIDSLIKASTNRVYENPDESIELGLSSYENNSYSIKTRTRALMLVSLAYTSKRDYQKALEYIIKASELSSELNDNKLQIEILFRTGILYQQLKIFDKSIEYLEKTEQSALIYPVQDSVRVFLASSYLVKGFIYKDNLNCDIALEFFDKGIREYEKLKETPPNANLSIAYYNKGNCYTMLSNYPDAKNSFYKSIAFAQMEKATSLVSFAQKGLAEVYTLEGNYEQSVELLQTAMAQSSKVGDLVLNSGIYNGLFENYLALQKWDEYQKYYDLYLKTQLKIKISERNSISDSIAENSKNQNQKLDDIHNQFKTTLQWIVIIVIGMILSIILMNRKYKKTIIALQNKVKAIQNSKTSTET